MTDEYGKKCLQTENGNTDEGTLSYLIRVWGRGMKESDVR